MTPDEFFDKVVAYAATMPRPGYDYEAQACYYSADLDTGRPPCLIGQFMSPEQAAKADMAELGKYSCAASDLKRYGLLPEQLEGLPTLLLRNVQEVHDDLAQNWGRDGEGFGANLVCELNLRREELLRLFG